MRGKGLSPVLLAVVRTLPVPASRALSGTFSGPPALATL